LSSRRGRESLISNLTVPRFEKGGERGARRKRRLGLHRHSGKSGGGTYPFPSLRWEKRKKGKDRSLLSSFPFPVYQVEGERMGEVSLTLPLFLTKSEREFSAAGAGLFIPLEGREGKKGNFYFAPEGSGFGKERRTEGDQLRRR